LTDLLRACLPVLRVPEAQAAALRPRPPPLWTASDAIRQMTRLMAELPDGSLLAAFLPKIDRDAPKRPLRCRAAIASNLIAAWNWPVTGVWHWSRTVIGCQFALAVAIALNLS
jgi:hypothetical protein